MRSIERVNAFERMINMSSVLFKIVPSSENALKMVRSREERHQTQSSRTSYEVQKFSAKAYLLEGCYSLLHDSPESTPHGPCAW